MGRGACAVGSRRRWALLILCFGAGCGDDTTSNPSGVGSGAAGFGALAGTGPAAAGSGTGAAGGSGRLGFPRRGSAGTTGITGTAGRGSAGTETGVAGRGTTGAPPMGAAGAPATGTAGAAPAPTGGGATFTQVYALFTRSCAGPTCHVGTTTGGGARLAMLDKASAHRSLVGATSTICRGERRVVAGNPQRSQLLHTLTHTAVGSCTGTPQMPVAQPRLPQADIDLVSSWISGGAPNN